MNIERDRRIAQLERGLDDGDPSVIRELDELRADRNAELLDSIAGSQVWRGGIGSAGTPGTEYPERTIYTDDVSGLYYVPFISQDGRVGYRVGVAREWTPEDEAASWETFIYLVPSTSIDAPAPNRGDVFVYTGTTNDPAEDEAHVFIPIDDEAFGL